MHVTRILFGIRGIFPLIKQHAPQCITTLPSFASLPHKSRLAIDATLLVQRLHFADDHHEERHVIGFARLIKQLREHDLIPIMVFDGVGQGARLPAKMREHEKRRMKRGMLTLRAKIESQRAKRLKRLQFVLQKWSDMNKEQRRQTTALLQKWTENEEAQKQAFNQDEWYDDWIDQQQSWLYSNEQAEPQKLSIENDQISLDNLYNMHKQIDESTREIEIRIEREKELEFEDESVWNIISEQVSGNKPSSTSSPHSLNQIWSQVKEVESSEEIQLASQFWALRRQHADQVARTGTMSTSFSGMMIEWPTETPSQQMMTSAEGEVYKRMTLSIDQTEKTEPLARAGDDLVNTAALSSTADQEASAATAAAAEESGEDEAGTILMPEELDISTAEQLSIITERNAQMRRSYVRSSTTLSPSIFTECAAQCEVLHVPVLWTGDGSKGAGRPHEAEAMAAMLVRHGYADMVASEDSDVLLYDVPLLRGVMGHKKLELVDSSAVRRSFFPPVLQAIDGTQSLSTTTSYAMSEEIEEELSDSSSEDLIGSDQSMESALPKDENVAERISKRQMLDFALLCGTDFNRTIPGIGPRRALKLIRDFGSIDGIRQEAAQRALQEKRNKAIAGKQQNTNDQHPSPIAPTAPIGGLVSSVRTQSGQLKLPDDVTWREYSKELTQARRVFEHPPTLFWQARKIRDLKRDPSSDVDAKDGSEGNLEELMMDESQTNGREISTKKNRTLKSKHPASPVNGFGSSPFGDGGPVAVWR